MLGQAADRRSSSPLFPIGALLTSLAVGILALGGWLGSAYAAVANVACFVVVISWSATSVRRIDAERRRAEEARHASETRIHAVIENMSEGIVIADLDGQLLHWNRAALDMHGFAESAEVELRLPEFRSYFQLSTLDGQILPLADWPMSRLFRGERLRDYQLRVRRLDKGWERIFAYGGDVVVDSGGRRLAFCTMVDITSIKETEVALRASRKMLQSVLDNVPQGVFWKDRDSRYLGCNLVVSRALGVAGSEAIAGKTDTEIGAITADQAAFFLSKDREVMETDTPQYRVVEPITRADGTTRWLETSKVPMHDDAGQVIGVLGTWEDVTDRRRHEEAIAGYNERLKILHEIDKALIARASPEAIAAAALPRLRELLGVRRTVVNLFDWESRQVEWLAAAGPNRVHVGPGVRYALEFMGGIEALRRGEVQMVDVNQLPPGPEVDALLASSVDTYLVVPMISEGELIGALSFGGSSVPPGADQLGIAQEAATQFAVAITQARLHERVQRHAEELECRVQERTRELQQAHAELTSANAGLTQLTAELQVANRELDAFSYSVSHDLRAPLRAIDGFTRIVLEEYGLHLPAEGQSFLRDVRASTLQMGRLVDDLLAFCRLGRQPLKKQTVEPRNLVAACLEDLKRAREGRDVEIRIGDLPACQADPGLLKQVWINLLANALKYTSKRPQAVVEIGCTNGNGRPAYFVKDNGVGFDMRYAHKLFGVFQRLHRAEDYEGTGVGLAIVQRIIQRHGGAIWAEAEVDRGATFFFSLENGGHPHA